MIDIVNFQDAFSTIQTSGYVLIFLIMIAEGPIITTAAAFAASLGIFNIGIIFVLSFLGDVIGDLAYYGIGRSLRVFAVEKYELRLGLKKSTIKKMEKKLKQHLGKTLFIIKFDPLFVGVGLMLAGALRTNIKKYLFYSIIITLPRTIFFTALGFYFGSAINSTLKYLNIGEYLIPIVLIILILIIFIIKKYSKKLFKF